MKMHRPLQYMLILVFLMVKSIQAYSHNEQGCLTWEIRRNRLILTCRLTNLSKQVYLIDNHEQEYIRCTLKEQINSCISPHASQSIFVNSSINTITLTIRKIDEHNVDGKWRCKQGNNAYETEVSAAKGIISATDIHLNGEILNTGTAQKVKLKCHSCREPRHNYAEFLINGSSTDGISYNRTSDKCSNQYGECKPHVCSCHRSGNEFINLFNVTNVFGTYYSCEMRFNDNDKKSIFSMERTVYVNDTVFYISSEIKLIKRPSKRNDRKIKTEEPLLDKDSEKKSTKLPIKGNDKSRRTEETAVAWTWIVIGYLLVFVFIFSAIITLIYVVVRRSINKDVGMVGESKNTEKQKHPLLGGSDKCFANQGKEVKLLPGETHSNENDSILVNNQKDFETTMMKDKQCDIEEKSMTNEHQTQDMAMEIKKLSNLQDDVDATAQLTDVLQPDKKEAKTTVLGHNVKTDVNIIQIKQNGTPTEAEICIEEQNEGVQEAVELSESTQHDEDMERIFTKGPETEEFLNETPQLCQPCEKTSINVPACYWCQNCKEAVCKGCKENHFQSHTFDIISSPLVLLKISNWCENHPNQQYKYFCKVHNSLCCVECKHRKHKSCIDIPRILDASKHVKSSKDVDEYKKDLEKFSKSFHNLNVILKTGEHNVQTHTNNLQSKIESNCSFWIKENRQEECKAIYAEHVEKDKNTCLLKLQNQISTVLKYENYITKIRDNFERIQAQYSDVKLFLMVHISINYLKSTLKKAEKDSKNINLVFNPLSFDGRNLMLGYPQKVNVLPQNDEINFQYVFI